MNKRDVFNVASTANGILMLWHSVRVQQKTQKTEHLKMWHKQDACQAYQDALNCMRHNGLIEDYDVEKIRVKVNGVWNYDLKGIRV